MVATLINEHGITPQTILLETAEGRRRRLFVDMPGALNAEEFEAALLAREQKRASLGKIRALKDASSARPAPATTSGTKANEDGPRTLTAGMSADRPTSERRNRALTPREEKLELEERLRRAARLVR